MQANFCNFKALTLELYSFSSQLVPRFNQAKVIQYENDIKLYHPSVNTCHDAESLNKNNSFMNMESSCKQIFAVYGLTLELQMYSVTNWMVKEALHTDQVACKCSCPLQLE